MPFESPHRSRESILVFAKEGVGKSTCWLKVAALAQSTGSSARFFVGYTDNAVPRQLEEGYPNLTNVYPTPLFEMPEYTKWVKSTMRMVNPNDFVVVDLINTAWSEAQDYYTAQVFGEDMGNFFMQARKTMSPDDKTLRALDGWKDWSVINKLYNDFYFTLIQKARCHVFATAHQEKLMGLEDQSIKDLYELIGARPAGQKFVGGGFQTVLYMQGQGNLQRFIRTVKDRERQVLDNVPFTNFAVTYLKGIAGWTM